MTFKRRCVSGVKAFFALAVLLAAFGQPACAADLHERAKNLYDVGDYRAAFDLTSGYFGPIPTTGSRGIYRRGV
jgi:hypothetical protein